MKPIELKHFLKGCIHRSLGFGLSSNFRPEFSKADSEASGNFSVIIPIHDSKEVVVRCLDSLQKHGGKAEIILVDDGSKEAQTIELLNTFAHANSWKLIRNQNAIGHSEATRMGIHQATRPLLCLLNSDTVVPPSTWKAIYDVFANDQKVAVVGPSTCHSHSKQCLGGIKERRFVWTDGQIYHFAARNASFWKALKFIVPQAIINSDVKHVGGFAFFIRRQIWDQTGGFDARLKDYFNESDLCYRLVKKGYRIIWTKEAYVHHLAEQSYGKGHEVTINVKKTAAEKVFLEIHGQF